MSIIDNSNKTVDLGDVPENMNNKADVVDSNGEPMEEDKKPSNAKEKIEKEDQAPEVSTSGDAVVKKCTEDVTLILSADDETETLCANTTEDLVAKDADVKHAEILKKKKDTSPSVWVSNISRTTKASELKKIFSKHELKVVSAKIVTNGRSFFGYISLESRETAEKAVKVLNNLKVDGKHITVSFGRPDLKGGEGKRKRESVTTKDLKDTAKKSDDDSKKDDKKTSDEDTRKKRDTGDKSNMDISEVKKQLSDKKDQLRRAQRTITEMQKRLNTLFNENRDLRKDVTRLEKQMRQEKRRLSQEREQAEKKRKLDEVRYDADRAVLNKELDECRKLREYLQGKIDELTARRRSRSRSPEDRGEHRQKASRSRPLLPHYTDKSSPRIVPSTPRTVPSTPNFPPRSPKRSSDPLPTAYRTNPKKSRSMLSSVLSNSSAPNRRYDDVPSTKSSDLGGSRGSSNGGTCETKHPPWSSRPLVPRYDRQERNRTPPPPPKYSTRSPKRSSDPIPSNYHPKSKKPHPEVVLTFPNTRRYGGDRATTVTSNLDGARGSVSGGTWGTNYATPWRYGASSASHPSGYTATAYPFGEGMGRSVNYGQFSKGVSGDDRRY